MKYFMVFLLSCVALTAAAPQYITSWPGFVAPGIIAPSFVAPGLVAPGISRTVVAGPTVVNGVDAAGVPVSRIISPGVVGTTII